MPVKNEVKEVLGCIAGVCTEFRTQGATHLTCCVWLTWLFCLFSRFIWTNYMEQRPWKANRSSASWEIPGILWNIQYHIHKSPSLILSWGRSTQIMPPSHFLKTILILSSHLCLGLPSGLFPSGFPTISLYAPHLSPHMCYMPPISNYSWFVHPNNIIMFHNLITNVPVNCSSRGERYFCVARSWRVFYREN